MSEPRFAWIKSVSGAPVPVGAVTVSGEPVRVLVTPQLSTAYRDRQIVICDGPGAHVPVMVAEPKKSTKKEAK